MVIKDFQISVSIPLGVLQNSKAFVAVWKVVIN